MPLDGGPLAGKEWNPGQREQLEGDGRWIFWVSLAFLVVLAAAYAILA